MTNYCFGYARVSTEEQSLDVQKLALIKEGADEIFLEKITGTKINRPKLQEMKSRLRKGDTVIVTRMDRLGRSTKDLLQIITEFRDRGIGLKIIDQNIDTSKPEGKLFFTIVAAFAEFERDLISARVKEGLKVARARGKVGGVKKILSVAKQKLLL